MRDYGGRGVKVSTTDCGSVREGSIPFDHLSLVAMIERCVEGT